MGEYEPEYVPFAAPTYPSEDKKKKPEKEQKKKEKQPEKKPPEKQPEKKPPEKKPPEKKLKEIQEEIKTYTWQMVGTNYQIMLADSENILVALMLDSAPSEPIKEALLKFSSIFQQNFATEIENFRGNVSWFRPASVIADETFNMFLMRPQCLPLTDETLNAIPFTATEKKIVTVAKEICLNSGYFFLATLLEEVMKRTKMPQERVLRAFFTLNRKGAFIPIAIEDVVVEVEKRHLWNQVACVDGISDEECELLLEDMLQSTEESRIALIAKLLEFKKKTRGIQVREEIVKRRRIRKERDERFKQVDEYLRANDFNTVIAIFNEIIRLSVDLGEDSIAEEISKRADVFRAELDQMAQTIPAMRSQRNEALNQAEMLELSGKYEEAAQQFNYAAEISNQIGEIDKAKEYNSQAQRLISLAELARLRERLR